MQIARHRLDINQAIESIVCHHTAIRALQEACPHTWQFMEQVNAHHELHWHVHYKCKECDTTKVERDRTPVCRVCDSDLVLAGLDDVGARCAVRLAGDPNGNGGTRAYRCSEPICNELYILYVLGD